MAYTHLHVHSIYSTFDGMVRIEDLFKRAQELGMEGVALTDHGRMYGVPEFLSCAKKYPDIKPIVGCELYICDEDKVFRQSKASYHLIALAKNLTGYRNLCQLVTIANTESKYGHRPIVSRERLAEYHEGLIVTSACIGGDIPQAILSDDMESARFLVQWYKNVFGEDFYLEISQHQSCKPDYQSDLLDKQRKANQAIFVLAREYGVKVVATNDVHFLNASDASAHDVLLCVSTKKTMSDKDRFQYTGQEYFKSEEDMLDVFPDHPEAITNTMEVLDKIERYEISMRPILPEMIVPGKYDSETEWLTVLACEGLQRRYAEKDEDTRLKPLSREDADRLVSELDMVRDKGGVQYLLMLKDFIWDIRRKGITVGPGRGSSPSLLLSYALGLSDINPMEHGLLAERCYNRNHKGLPDYDFDFSWKSQHGSNRLDAVYKLCQKKYGVKKVSKVIVFQRRGHLAAICDVFKALGLSMNSVRNACNAVPVSCFGFMPFRSFLSDSTYWEEETSRFRKWYSKATAKEKEAIQIADKLLGLIVGTGVHACATLICGRSLSELMPMETVESGESVSQYDGQHVEDMGPVKMDFLSLRTLDILDAASIKASIPELYNDPKVFELFAKGDTVGVFQFESAGMKQWLKSLKPDSLNDLVALNAMYRPGPMDYIPDFIESKKNPGHISFESDVIGDCLKETYGLMIYQEQEMAIAKKFGFTPEEADRLRKATGKKMAFVMEELKPKFFDGGKTAGLKHEELARLWNDIETRGMHLFMKSHALCYTTLAYKCAWLKVYRPKEFYAAALANSFENDRQMLIDDAKAHGVKILHPDAAGSRE